MAVRISNGAAGKEPALKKRVYLFELDSVRMSDADVIAGQWALYREIVVNGNVVVLTFNQLVDSRGFLSLLTGPIPQSDEEEQELQSRRMCNSGEDGDTPYGQALMDLFRARAIRISQFGSLRTISQYLLNAIEDDKHFVYSALPLKYRQKRLTALVQRCLRYSDLSELHGYFSVERQHDCSAALRRLFAEVDDQGNVIEPMAEPGKEDELAQRQKRILRNLYALLKTVIRLSTMDYIYINPRDPDEYEAKTVVVEGERKRYCGLRLSDYLNAVIPPWQRNEAGSYRPTKPCMIVDCTKYPVDKPLWEQACAILCSFEEVRNITTVNGRGHEASCFAFGDDNRSVYIRLIKDAYKRLEDKQGNAAQPYLYAEAIVNVCYNYACEASIRNISKHYNVAEIREDAPDKTTFVLDFCHRLEQDWGREEDNPVFDGAVYLPSYVQARNLDREKWYLNDESNEFEPFDVEQYRKTLPDFFAAGRMVQYGDYVEDAARERGNLLALSVSDVRGHDNSESIEKPVLSVYAQGHTGVERYESQLSEQRVKHKKRVVHSIWGKIGTALLCVCFACVIELGMNTLEDVIVSADGPPWLEFILRNGILGTLIFLFVAEYLTGLLTKPFPWMVSLSEALGNMFIYCRDLMSIRKQVDTYATPSSSQSVDAETKTTYEMELFNKARPIDFVLSQGLKRYLRLFDKQFEKQLRVVRDAGNPNIAGFSEAPNAEEALVVAQVDDRAVQQALVDQEELFGYQFGIVYSSDFNRMIVDPIVRDERLPMITECGKRDTARYYPYERLMPSQGDGVVMVVRTGDCFVLLNQYRHATRCDMLGFPRGYAEPGQTAAQNACRELKEELGVDVREGDLIPLGRLAPDSGLTGGIAHVFYVEIDGYVQRSRYEGIVQVCEVTESNLEELIGKSKEIYDGYTIGAFFMYKLYYKYNGI